MGEQNRNRPKGLSFAREALLQQAFANLLARMDWVSGIQILQGSQEHGKDLVFKTHGGLREAMVCACVIKNKPFSGVAGRSGNLRSVIEQAEQAFNIPYIDEQRREVFVDTVYVVNPHPASAAAVKSIQGALPTRRIVFITGAELLRLFQQYWPTFLRDEASVLSQFERGLEQVADTAKGLKVLRSEQGLSAASSDRPPIFVPVAFERELRLYAIDRDAYNVLGATTTHGRRSREGVSQLAVRLRELTEFLKHLEEWSFPGVRFVPSITNVTTQLTDAVRRIEEATLRAYSSAVDRAISSLNQIPPGVEVPLLAQDEMQVGKLSETATVAAQQLLVQVEERLRTIAVQAPSFQREMEQDLLVDDSEFRDACRVDDCFRAMPHAKVSVVESLRFVFSSELHRRTTKSLLIVGGPGLGKTTFCTRNALLDARRVLADAPTRRPAYVSLHHAAKTEATTFEALFLGESSRSTVLLNGEDLKGEIRLYLDGFDEIVSQKRRREILDIARDGVAGNPKRQVIVTSRDAVSDACLSWLPRISLSHLAGSQVRQLAEQWLRDGDVTEEFMSQLEAVPSLFELARVPLLATVTILVFQRTKRMPRDRTHLYQTFSDLLCGGWDLAKGVVRGSEFGLVPKRAVLELLAYDVHRASTTSFQASVLERCAKRVMPSLSELAHDRLKRELEVDGIIVRSGEQLYFSHLSFQEYFAARYIRLAGDERVPFMLIEDAGHTDTWWREVLRFFVGMHASVEEALSSLQAVGAGRGVQVLRSFVYDVLPGATS